MIDSTTDPLTELESRIGYAFRKRELLIEALSHRSHANEVGDGQDNQRLEFFGDSILSFLVSSILYKNFPDAREGRLTRMRGGLVDEPALAKVALSIDLGSALLLGKGEEKSGGRLKPSILADGCEALLAAVYLDGGITAAKRVVKRLFESSIETLYKGSAKGEDYKTELQELVQSRGGNSPGYRLAGSSGPDHERLFVVEVMIDGAVAGRGEGGSKKRAEQAAAAAALATLRR